MVAQIMIAVYHAIMRRYSSTSCITHCYIALFCISAASWFTICLNYLFTSRVAV